MSIEITDEVVEALAVDAAEHDGYDWAQIAEEPRHGNDERWCRQDYRIRVRRALEKAVQLGVIS